jgi:tetratricopeptide (TPR) repeat protein
MANAILLPGFLNQALIFGFRIGETQVSGRGEIERFLFEPPVVLTFQEASDSPAFAVANFAKICGGYRPAFATAFARKAPPPDASSASANERIVEGFISLIDILCSGLERDMEAALEILETGSIPVAKHDASDYDAACIAFEEAVAQSRNEARYGKLPNATVLLVNQLATFTNAVNSEDPMDLLTWSLRTLAHLPHGWELPGLILQLLTAQMEWKMLLFASAADTLQDIARQMIRMRHDGHDWEFEGHLHYLAGAALLVTSFSEMKDALDEAIDEFQGAIHGFEQARTAGPEIHARLSLCFAAIGDILESRGRRDEAAVAYKLADIERENAATSRR